MELYLMKRGWIQKDSPNEWTKYDWTIRFYENYIEVFNDPDKVDIPKYFLGKKDEVDLGLILDEIEEEVLD